MDYMEKYSIWLNSPVIDEQTAGELRSIADNPAEIEDRFHKDLEFGTGGLRGIMGAGTNRMNVYTVRKATLGLANYILANEPRGCEMGAVIAFDSRHNSGCFALEAALTLVAAGIKVYLFDGLRPTPVLSFAVRHLGCAAGIVVTASHNPPDYNGYKAYWSDGCQIPYPRDEEVIGFVNAIADLGQLVVADKAKAVADGMLVYLDGAVDEAYQKQVLALSLNRDAIFEAGLKILYTPLHGAGLAHSKAVLAAAGFENVHVVPSQEQPDPNFTTIAYPNPEDPKAFAKALELAHDLSADIIVANDPDADRVGVMVKHGGEYVLLAGNQTGTLLAQYLLSGRKANGTLPPNPGIISTIVSTNMTREIAAAYGAEYAEVLTGFKFIGEQIEKWENSGKAEYVFGFEESIGFLPGPYARDKDAIASSMLICEVAAVYKIQGKTLIDAIGELYKKYGWHKEHTVNIVKPGLDGAAQIRAIMADKRNNPPKSVNNIAVSKIRDYQNGYEGLPPSDVLYYELADGSWLCIRPSGTEPKIKIYCGILGKDEADAKAKIAGLADAIENMV